MTMWVRAEDGSCINLEWTYALAIAPTYSRDERKPREVRAYEAASQGEHYWVMVQGTEEECQRYLDALSERLGAEDMQTSMSSAPGKRYSARRLASDGDCDA